MEKRALECSSDELELRYPYGNKRLRFSHMIYYSKDNVKLLNENNIIEVPYVYINPREEFLGKQAYKENNRLNLEDYFFESSSMAVALYSTKKPMLSICRKALRELQFLKYFEKLGWKSDLITEYCRTSHTDINTLMKELNRLFLQLKECNLNVDKIIEQCSKDKKNIKLFFEYLTEYLQSMKTRKPVIILKRIDIDLTLNLSKDAPKRKVQEMTPDQNKVDDTDYREIKRANRRKSCAGIREDLNVNKPFVPPYNLQQDINKSSSTTDNRRLRKSLDSLEEAESGTHEEALSIRSEFSKKPVGADIEYSCDQSCIFKPDEKNKELPSRKLAPQNIQDDSNHDAEKVESSDTIQSTDSLKESEARIDTGIEENILPKSNEQVCMASSRLIKRGIRRTKDTQQSIPLPHNLDSTSKPTPPGKQTTTSNTSFIEEKTANESGDSSKTDERLETGTEISSDSVESNRLRKRDVRWTKDIEERNNSISLNLESSCKPTLTGRQITISTNGTSSIEEEGAKETVCSSKNDERMDASSKKREPLISSDKVYTKRDCLRKRSTRGTKVFELCNDNGMGLNLNSDTKCKLFVEKNSENTAINGTVGGMKHPMVSTIGKDESTEDCDISEIKTDSLDLKEIETEDSFTPTENDRSGNKLGDSFKQTEVGKETLQIENVPLINSEEYAKINASNENDDTGKNKDMDSEIRSLADQLKSGKENKQFVNKSHAPKDDENEMGQNADTKSDKYINVLRDSVESVLEERTDTDVNCFKTNVPISGSTDIDVVKLSENEFERPTSKLKEKESLIKNDTINKRIEINKIVEGVKQMELSSNKIPNSSQLDAESKSSHLGEQILEECAASISNIVSPQKFDVSTNSSKETPVVLKPLTVKLNVLTSYLDGYGKIIEINRREMFPKVSDCRKADEWTESPSKYKEHKDLQEKIIHFENSERTKNDEEREHIEVKSTKEFPISVMGGQQSQCEKKTIENANYLESFQNSSKGSAKAKRFEDKWHSVTVKEDSMKDSSSKRIETNKRSTVVVKRSFDIESLISLDEPKDRTDTFTEEKQFEKNSAEAETYSATIESTISLKESDTRIEVGMKEHISSKSDEEACMASTRLRKRDVRKTQDTQKNASLPVNLELKSKPTTTGKLITMTTNDTSSIEEETVNESRDPPRSDEILEIGTEKREQLISSDSAENSRLRKKVISNTNDVQKNITPALNLESKGKPTPTEKQVTKSRNDTTSIEEQTANESSDSLRNELIEVGTEKRESLISCESAESSRLRKKVTRKTKEIENILLPHLERKGNQTPTEIQVTVPTNDTSSVKEQTANESGGSQRNHERMEDGTEEREPFISCDSAENSRLRKRVTRMSKDVGKNIPPLNLQSKSNPIATEKQVTIPANDTSSVEEQMANESESSLRSHERMDDGAEEREPFISCDSAESSRLRKRVTRKAKDVENILLPHLERKGNQTPTEIQVTVPTNDTSSVKEQTANESGGSQRNHERMEDGTEEREPFISCDSAESSPLRKRVTRMSKDVGENIPPLNLQSKSKPIATEKQVTIPANDTSSVEEQMANESESSLRSHERMDDGAEEREPFISCDSAESSRLRKKVTRKAKDVENILLPHLERKGNQTPTEIQVTVPTNDTSSVKEQTANESGGSQRNHERMEDGTEEREPFISCDSAESSRLRKRVTKMSKDVGKNIPPLNLQSKSKPIATEKQVTIPANDTSSVEEQMANESESSLRSHERMDDGAEEREPFISCDSAESSRLRKRVTKMSKDVGKNIPPLNLQSKSKPIATEKQVTIPANDTSSVEEQMANESESSLRSHERMDDGAEEREPFISCDSAESSRLRKRVTRKAKDVENILLLHLERKGNQTPTEIQVTVPTNDTSSVKEQTANESGGSQRNHERMEDGTEEREPFISCDSAESSRLRKRVTRMSKDVGKNIPPLNLQSKSKPIATEKQVTIPANDTSSVEEQMANESESSLRSHERMDDGAEEREPFISCDSAKSSRLRKRVTRKTKDVEKNILLLNLESKSKPTPTKKQITIQTNDTSSVNEETANESGHSSRNDEIMEVSTEDREPLISSDSAESSRLRKRVTRKTKEVDKNITFPLNLESKSEPTPAGKRVTIPTNDNSSIEKDTTSESGDSPRNDKTMEVDTEKREPLISSDSAENSRLRKRVTRKTKEVDKVITLPSVFESKSESTPTEKQDTISTLETSIDEQTANESGYSLRNERMEVDTDKREPLISSDSAENSRLRKRVTRKTKEVDKVITLPSVFESKSESTPTEKQDTISTLETSIDEQMANESGYSLRNERMEGDTQKRESLISSDNAESSRLRKRAPRKTKEVDKNIILNLVLESKSKLAPTEEQVTIPIRETSSIEEQTANESGDSLRNNERMEVPTEKRLPLISSDSTENSRLRKRITRKTKEVEKTTLPLNLQSKCKPTATEKQVTIPLNDTISIEKDMSSEPGDSLRNDERMEVDKEKREPLINSDSAENSRLRKRVTRKTKEVEIDILHANVESKGKPTPTENQVIIPTNDVSSISEGGANESGDLSRNDERMEASKKKREPLISSDKDAKRDCLRKRSTRGTKVIESENDNGTTLILNFDTAVKQPVRENISEITPGIGVNVGDDISEGTETGESIVDKSTNLSSETKGEANDDLKAKVIVDIDVSQGSTETKIKSIKNGGLELVRDLLIEDCTTIEINERRKSSENKRRPRRKDEQLVVRVLKNQGESATEVAKNNSLKRNRNNVKITRNDENGAIRDLRKYDEESMKTDESERSRNKNKVKTQIERCDPVKDLRNQQLDGDSNILENGLSKTNELKLLTIRICDVAEDLRKQAEGMEGRKENGGLELVRDLLIEDCTTIEINERRKSSENKRLPRRNTKQVKNRKSTDINRKSTDINRKSTDNESTDNEISQFWCFQTKDTEKRSFEDVGSQMSNNLYLRLESMDLNKEHMEKTTMCPDFKANGNSISCLYDTFQEADFPWQCYKLQASSAESSRSISSNQFLSENVDVLQMLKMDDDIENQIFVGNDLSLLEGLNTGLPALYPIQSTSSVMSLKKVS